MAKSIPTVISTLPNLMQGLKIIWYETYRDVCPSIFQFVSVRTMSKHYNKDERFVPLLEKIAQEIIHRVRQTIDLRTLLSSSSTLNEAKDLCHQAKQLLVQWKDDYQNVRMKLENDKRGFSTWNFDHHLLFDQTDYMSHICDDLIQMLSELTDFYEMFGSELKAVTGDEPMIDGIVEHVSQLKQSFVSCDFDFFHHDNAEQWRRFLEEFKHRSIGIEQEAKVFLRTAFTQLRSAETALDMLRKFQQINTTHVLAQEMTQQFAAILVQYGKEIDLIEQLFHQQKANPPIFKVRNDARLFSWISRGSIEGFSTGGWCHPMGSTSLNTDSDSYGQVSFDGSIPSARTRSRSQATFHRDGNAAQGVRRTTLH
jgi:hypothetical protein